MSFGAHAATKVRLAVLTVAALTVGAVPGAVLLAHPWWLVYFAGGALVATALTLRTFQPADTVPPGGLEVFLAWVGAIFPGAMLSWVVITFYWTTYWVVTFAAFVADRIHWTLPFTPSRVALVVATAVAIFIAAAFVFMAARQLSRSLYPPTAGLRSPFYTLASTGQHVIALVTIVAVVALAALLWAVERDGPWFSLLLAAYFLALSANLWERGEKASRTTVVQDAGRAVERLLTAQGFDVVISPRTGQADIDPFLQTIDLYGERGDQGFVVSVKGSRETGEGVPAAAASTLASAAWALTDARERLELGATKVEPLLVLVGENPSSSLDAASTRESVHIARIGDANQLARALITEDRQELRTMAEALLGPVVAPRSSGATSESASQSAS